MTSQLSLDHDLPDHMLNEVWAVLSAAAEDGGDGKQHEKGCFKFESDIIVPDRHFDEEALKSTAKELVKGGTQFLENSEVNTTLAKEIAKHMMEVASEFQSKYGDLADLEDPPEPQSGVFGSLYTWYKSKLEPVLSPAMEVGKIAVVTALTKDVVDNVRTSGYPGNESCLPMTLSYLYITENFKPLLRKKNGLINAIQSKVDQLNA